MRRIAISDIHGCYKTFQYLIQEKIQLTLEDKLYLLGDYIDRGPGSKEVLDFIMSLREQGYIVHCLMGNHEAMMINSINDLSESRRWMFNGGAETMESFQAESLSDIPEKYWDFLRSLRTHLLLDDYVLVHAGINFEVLNPLEDEDSCIWLRHWYDKIDKDWLDGRIIVHGHTVTIRNAIEQRIQDQDFLEKPYLDIDAGCCYSILGAGHLCAFDLDEKTVIFQERLDDLL